MSPRAAARLEALGFERVYDYVGGKKAWLAAGLAMGGKRAGERRSGDLARQHPPACRPEDRVGDLRDRDDVAEWGVVAVLDDRNVLHGALSPQAIAESSPETAVEDVMDWGPTTIRPSRSIDSALDRMNDLGTDHVLVTTEFGELSGILYRSDIEPHDEDD